jgi:hypothetical protein
MLKPKSIQESFYGSYLYDRIVPIDHLLRKTPWQTFLDGKKLADDKMLDRLQPTDNTVREVVSVR